MLKKIVTTSLLLLALVFAVSCSKGSSESSAQPAAGSTAKKAYKIAFSNSYVGNAWRTGCVNIFKAYTDRLVREGVLEKAFVSSAGDDVQAQINEIRNMMSEGYDAIVTITASATGLNSVLEEAVERGIVVVAFDAHVDSDLVYNVNTDQIEFGRVLADWLVKAMGGKGNILWIKGIEGNAITNMRTEGMQSVLKNYPDIKVLGEGFGKWDLSTTAEVMSNLMSAHNSKGIQGILSEGGGGHSIVESLREYGYDVTKLPIAEGEMFNAYMKDWVELGLNTFTTAQPPYLVAASVDIALRVLNGETVDKMTYINMPTCSSQQEAKDKWYQPTQEGGFLCDWTDNDNTWNLTIEEVAPK
ncbi:MAG: substrate-binding domain-containing protein [Spirochaetales bacterium]|jgi:ribose transport system substrate-binding protein|nr:substrate-binding domain-containing protein [Spirochaetales bacterium]